MASTYLTKTLGTPTNNKKFTFSCWFKRSHPSTTMDILHAGPDGSNEAIICRIESDGRFTMKHDSGGSQEMLKQTNALYRDTNAWYHIVIIWDTDNSTAEDRQIVYFNGERITDWMTGGNDNFAGGEDILANKAVSHTIGRRNYGGTNYVDGLLSHVHFCDGYAYAASNFGSTDATTGEWKINTSPSVSYGNNGFFILKDGNSVTDQSGQGNNWTVSGGTLTKTEDNPSNVFCNWNPLIKDAATLSNGNTTSNNTSSSNWNRASGTLADTKGKYYAEFKITTMEAAQVGIIDVEQAYGTTAQVRDSSRAYMYKDNGQKGNNGSDSNYGNSFTDGDIIGIAVDLDNNKIYFSKNGTWQNSGVPTSGSTGTGSAFNLTDGFWFPAFSGGVSSSGNNFQINFGNGYFGTTAVSSAGTNASNLGIFEYDVPTGYTALCTKGLNE